MDGVKDLPVKAKVDFPTEFIQMTIGRGTSWSKTPT